MSSLLFLASALALPAFTYKQYVLYSQQQPDMSAFNAGFVSKRWVLENIFSFAYAVSLTASLVARLFGFDVLDLPAQSVFVDLLVVIAVWYSSILARTLGDFSEPAELHPANQLVELRRPRYIWYMMTLRQRMMKLRSWWVLMMLLHLYCTPFATFEQYFPLPISTSRLVFHLTRLLSYPTFFVEVLNLVNLGTLYLPIVIGCVSGFTVFWCSARDFSARMSPSEGMWGWPQSHSCGEFVNQRPPIRVLSQRTPLSSVLISPPRVSDTPKKSSLRNSPSTSTPMKSPSRGYTYEERNYVDTLLSLPPSTFRPLRVVILTIGTRGDVQPYLSLGHFLRESGHFVTICTTGEFQEMVESSGLTFRSIGVQTIRQPPVWVTVGSTAEFITATSPDFIAEYALVADCFREACLEPRCDVVLGTSMTVSFALNIAESSGIPCWVAKLAPDIPSAGMVTPGSTLSRVGILNFLRCMKYWLEVSAAANACGMTDQENKWRRKMGLGDVQTRQRVNDMTYTPQLLGYSRFLFPKPVDYPTWAFEVGFWTSAHTSAQLDALGNPEELSVPNGDGNGSFSGSESEKELEETEKGKEVIVPPAHQHVSPELRRFMLRRSARPIAVVTFGSMKNSPHRRSLLAEIVQALLKANIRVLLLVGWADRPELPPHRNLHVEQQAPHDWVFPRASLVLHHGGAGTTAMALSSGIPSVVIPMLRWADQPLWGTLLERAGVGALVRERDPHVNSVLRAVRRVLHARTSSGPTGFDGSRTLSEHRGALVARSLICGNANRLGAFVRAERSMETTLTLLESCLCGMVLNEKDRQEISPLGSGKKFNHKNINDKKFKALSLEQQMCVRHCVVCSRIRETQMQSEGPAANSDESSKRVLVYPEPIYDISSTSPLAKTQTTPTGSGPIKKRSASRTNKP